MLLLTGLRSISGKSPIPSAWRTAATKIDQLESSLEKLDDQQLRKESLSLRYEVLSGQSLDKVLVKAFALVRESARRHVAMRHYPVQLLGGIAMHFGSIAVMQTGEGKTLTATLPLYLAALEGKGAHLATANDYLAARDAELMTPVFQALGMSVGVVEQSTQRPQRQQAYRADITYSTAKEIGFDFLRDRLLLRQIEDIGLSQDAYRSPSDQESMKPVQRELHFMLVDEADSILIDEARTPLIISSLPEDEEQRRALYRWSADAVGEFEEGEHYEYDEEKRSIELGNSGRKLTRQLAKPELLATVPLMDIYDQVELALLVDRQFIRDRHYVIRDGEIVIVDEFTGRMAEGRKWRAGLHQAIEARENLEVTCETAEAARITIQDLFLKYGRISGMTGTVASSGRELNKIYDTRVIHIPTNRPPQRTWLQDLVFGTSDAKWDAIVNEIQEMCRQGRPVLVGTRSIDKSELLSQRLTNQGIEHEVLNARHLQREAEIVATAGKPGRVTVATNMAGRGTDIRLDPQVLEHGGLHVIISELHESERIDRQLVGRCGRQGDPGSFRFFMSLDDDILMSGFGPKVAARMKAIGAKDLRQPNRMARIFRQAQKRVEAKHFRGRKVLLYHEKQRQTAQREMGQDPYVDTII